MTTLNAAGAAKLTGQDLSRLKKYLSDNLLRALESEGVPVAQRDTFARQNINKVFEQTQLKLPEDLRKQIFDQVLNDLLGYGPIQSLLDDDEVTEIMSTVPRRSLLRRRVSLSRAMSLLMTTIMSCG